MRKSLFIIVTLFYCFLNTAFALDMAKEFKEMSVEGTILISTLKGTESYVHNEKRAKQRLSPASTFKIPNSLIALEEKLIKDSQEVIKWDGVNRELPAWNQDQTLATAIEHSAIWVYQEFAKKIGTEKYKSYLEKFSYGNKNPGPVLTTFWLKGGDLLITPYEQIEFLKKLYLRELPVSRQTQDEVIKIMKRGDFRQDKKFSLYYKTGAATKDWHGHGWYVGFVETPKGPYFFATNILLNGKQDLPLREKITLKILSHLI